MPLSERLGETWLETCLGVGTARIQLWDAFIREQTMLIAIQTRQHATNAYTVLI